jgi:quercetin 2,3-dioxygenase
MTYEIKHKDVLEVHRGQNMSDGAGVKLKRLLGTEKISMIDPFLLLDEFKSENPDDYIKGFPEHPHRGFETITYLKHGKFHHQDSKGNEGYITSGSVQWMTAGKGIIHSEMPEMKDGLLWGFQLWLNLPAKFKMTEPSYQEIKASEIPICQIENCELKIISGQFQDLKGPGKSFFPFKYFDIKLKANSVLEIPVQDDENVFVYLYTGKLLTGKSDASTEVRSGNIISYNIGNSVYFQTLFTEAEFLFFSAPAINEPVVRGGPFVMNTHDELIQAYRDYQEGKLDS